MTNIEDDPAVAFDELRREISVMVRALQGLTAEHDKLPDYSKTLEAIDTKLGVFATNLGVLAKTPALQFTPGALAGEIELASVAARAKDSELLRSAHLMGDRLMAELRGTLAQVRDARRQQQHLIWAAAAGIAFGILLWAILPGALVRSLPASWRAPEWMAARVIGTDEATAARRLLKLPRAAAFVRRPAPLSTPTPSVRPRKHRHART
jgi:hypothetical protein